MKYSKTKNRIISKILSVFFILLSILASFNGINDCSEIDIKSNYLEYDDKEQYILAKDSVTVTWSDKILKADTVKYWTEKNYLFGENNVVFSDNDNIVYGESIMYDLKTKTGEIHKATAFFKPWIFHTKKAIKTKKNKYKTKRAKFSSCDLDEPHYYIHATHTTIIPEKRIFFYNPVFLLYNIPIFYLPIYSQGLGKHKHTLEVKPGYNNLDGFVALCIYGYPITANTYAKFYVDYFSKRGLGTGAEFNYDVPGKLRGTMYGYRIKEKLTDENSQITEYNERWNLRAEHWQRINPLWSAQARFDFMSDSSFNNYYFQENWMRIVREINSHLSISRQSSRSVLRFTGERTDAYDDIEDAFKPETIVLPRISHTLFPVKNKYGFYFGLNTELKNEYNYFDDFYTWDGSVDANVKRNIRLTRRLILTPTQGIIETWRNRNSKGDFEDIVISRYYSNTNLRYRLIWWIDWNLLHEYKIRSQESKLDIDYEADDQGVERDMLTYQNIMYVHRRVRIRNSLPYNFQRNRSDDVYDWRLKFEPLINEIIWNPKYMYSLILREETVLYPWHYMKSFQGILNFGRDEKYVNCGVSYQAANPKDLDMNMGLGVWLTEKWKIKYSISVHSSEYMKIIKPSDQELKIFRDLHCWNFQFTFRKRLEYEEVLFLIDLKSAMNFRKSLFKRPHEKEFYPWR